ncbi:hypothetical protein ATK17_0010 [Branchiibius hedensis]|uniref:Uncharacterized protein n=1 Tax=Branchiibius hedensis TaxID=672460 RepID=A0A2Y8ZS44_9MICO|nr:hypothetical protein [Branchiibius hedensis]PWJ22812.1 hypothetical protein ATK17_3982 [Branchiibius hedensis]PWJ23929.1 hypothetical protein ATK17_0010 [Branchiibius hedensis]SSA32747.1 hypothetical protein SAMN04489750_0010 [Branchiibius hedensis]SSA59161.1 hypothetical protein SAMN04489750_3982 [Branchiibius hedensis]
MTAAATGVRMIPFNQVVTDSGTSASTVNRAMNKWKAGIDDGKFPPPLAYKRKGKGAKAERCCTTDQFADWLERWPED